MPDEKDTSNSNSQEGGTPPQPEKLPPLERPREWFERDIGRLERKSDQGEGE
jgi:hypothetical protein